MTDYRYKTVHLKDLPAPVVQEELFWKTFSGFSERKESSLEGCKSVELGGQQK
jgi:hypothetical protein